MKRHAIGLGLIAGGASLGLVGLQRMRGAPLPPALVAPGRFIELGGARIHYLDDGQGDPIVLVHGFGGSAFSWRHVMPLLSAQHRVVAIDLPGFGYSDRNTMLDFSQSAQAQRVVHLMDALGIAKATIVGHSMGGGVAQRLAIANPLRVERLVLAAPVDASGRTPMAAQKPWVRAIAATTMRAAGQVPPVVRSMVGRSLRQMVRDPAFVTKDMVDGYVEPLLIPGTAACVSKMARENASEPLEDLSRVRVPTLIVTGDEDGVTPANVTGRVVEGIPGAKHVVFEKAGHLLVEEQAEAFVEELLAFLHERAPAAR